MATKVLEDLHYDISSHLDEIRGYFKKPDQVKVTILVRNPWLKDGDVYITNDSTEEVIKALQQLETNASNTTGGKRE